MNVHPHRGPFDGRAQYRIAFISDPDGNIIELMQIQPGSPTIENEANEPR
jgi:hypothetical protein